MVMIDSVIQIEVIGLLVLCRANYQLKLTYKVIAR